MFIYLGREWGRGKEKERENPKEALHRPHGAQREA